MVSPDDFARLKQRVYVMRNGVVADTLRAGGCPYRLIFGLNLPQLREIAAEYGPDESLARELLAHPDLRENILMAMLLYPREALTVETAREWIGHVRWTEDADLLCFTLLRHADFAPAIASELCGGDDRLHRYTGLRLWLSQASKAPVQALADATAELAREDALVALASMVKDEADFAAEG